MARKSRFGKTFYSCSTFPECDVIVNELSQIEGKYPNHPRTAYVKKLKKGRRGATASKEKEEAKEKPAAKKSSTKKTAVKKTVEKKKTARIQPAVTVKKDLAYIVGSSELTRGEVIKKLWDYIKANNLQDPKNKRLIVPDAALAKVFGSKEPVDMMKLAGIVNKHLEKK